MSQLKFYTDTHIDKQVALQLRQRGIDVIRCEEVELADADDEAHLQYASENQLALITKDAGFRSRHFQWISQAKTHYGIFFCADRHAAAIGKIVNACYAYAQLIEEGAGTLDDIKNEFFDISQE
jgi:predicted nuclease of predicted toxin-antitoxin system